MNNVELDKREREENFVVRTVPLFNVEQILIDSIQDNPINKVIVEEMLDVFREYNKIKDINNE